MSVGLTAIVSKVCQFYCFVGCKTIKTIRLGVNSHEQLKTLESRKKRETQSEVVRFLEVLDVDRCVDRLALVCGSLV